MKVKVRAEVRQEFEMEIDDKFKAIASDDFWETFTTAECCGLLEDCQIKVLENLRKNYDVSSLCGVYCEEDGSCLIEY